MPDTDTDMIHDEDPSVLLRSILLAIHEQRASGDITDEQADAAVERLKEAADDPDELRRLLDDQSE